jgi:hypothetical protein
VKSEVPQSVSVLWIFRCGQSHESKYWCELLHYFSLFNSAINQDQCNLLFWIDSKWFGNWCHVVLQMVVWGLRFIHKWMLKFMVFGAIIPHSLVSSVLWNVGTHLLDYTVLTTQNTVIPVNLIVRWYITDHIWEGPTTDRFADEGYSVPFRYQQLTLSLQRSSITKICWLVEDCVQDRFWEDCSYGSAETVLQGEFIDLCFT